MGSWWGCGQMAFYQRSVAHDDCTVGRRRLFLPLNLPAGQRHYHKIPSESGWRRPYSRRCWVDRFEMFTASALYCLLMTRKDIYSCSGNPLARYLRSYSDEEDGQACLPFEGVDDTTWLQPLTRSTNASTLTPLDIQSLPIQRQTK